MEIPTSVFSKQNDFHRVIFYESLVCVSGKIKLALLGFREKNRQNSLTRTVPSPQRTYTLNLLLEVTLNAFLRIEAGFSWDLYILKQQHPNSNEAWSNNLGNVLLVYYVFVTATRQGYIVYSSLFLSLTTAGRREKLYCTYTLCHLSSITRGFKQNKGYINPFLHSLTSC